MKVSSNFHNVFLLFFPEVTVQVTIVLQEEGAPKVESMLSPQKYNLYRMCSWLFGVTF